MKRLGGTAGYDNLREASLTRNPDEDLCSMVGLICTLEQAVLKETLVDCSRDPYFCFSTTLG